MSLSALIITNSIEFSRGGDIGFINVQNLLTQLLSYFRIVTNPKAVFLTTKSISDNSISDEVKKRLVEMVDETLDLAAKTRQ